MEISHKDREHLERLEEELWREETREEALSGHEQKAAGCFVFIRAHRFHRSRNFVDC